MKALLLITVILMDFLVGMEFDLFVPSFPELQSQFELTPFWVEATLSVNFIGYCVSLFFVGEMADRYGRRPVILAGLMSFIVGSILCLYCPTYAYMLLGRFLQGVGVAAPSILSFLIIADSFELKKQQFYMAMLNGIMNISCACAPVLGCYTTHYFHWQGNFTLLLALGIFVFVMSMLFVPSHKPATREQPVRYRDIFKTKPLMLLIVQFIFMFVPWWVFVGIAPLLYMEAFGVSITDFGYYQGGLALVFAFGSLSYGFFMDRFNQRRLILYSNAAIIASIIALSYLSIIDCANPLVITLTFLLFIIGQIVPTTALFPMALSYIPEAKGRAAAIIQGGRLILSSLALQVAGYYYTGSFQSIGIILTFFIFMTSVLVTLVVKSHLPQEKEALEI
ncbi:MAG: MFS transporter [Verrucomicrobia bacterium]|nr:MFS transporter [Verrucomicrobiota bacterium]MBS0637432.1 MFS transporter [Verrucomicrobiota bacterium]